MKKPTPYRSKRSRASERGATLIEVLVAMVILATALLGMAALTSSSIKYNQFSRLRATGLSLVTDYAERARANLVGFANYAYTSAYTAGTRAAATVDPTTAMTACQITPINTCAAAVAAYDQSQWLTNVANRLPGGTAYITTELTPAVAGVAGLPATRIMNVWLIWTAIEEQSGFQQTQTCPAGANIPTDANVNCMYFRITL